MSTSSGDSSFTPSSAFDLASSGSYDDVATLDPVGLGLGIAHGTTAERVLTEALSQHALVRDEGTDDPTVIISALDDSPTGSKEDDEFGELEPELGPHVMDQGPQTDFKKVKVYELRNEAWFDRGTGHVHGLYDEDTDQALLVVTAEPVSLSEQERSKAEEVKKQKSLLDAGEDGGGFLHPDDDKDAGLGELPVIKGIRAKGVEGRVIMHSQVQGKDVYQRQQGQSSVNACFAILSHVSRRADNHSYDRHMNPCHATLHSILPTL